MKEKLKQTKEQVEKKEREIRAENEATVFRDQKKIEREDVEEDAPPPAAVDKDEKQAKKGRRYRKKGKPEEGQADSDSDSRSDWSRYGLETERLKNYLVKVRIRN